MSALAAVSSTIVGAALAADSTVKPGSPPPITFVVTALFALAVILLGLDLVRRVRRAQFKAEIHENLAAEIAERDATAGAAGAAPDSAQGPASDAASSGDEDPAPGPDGKA